MGDPIVVAFDFGVLHYRMGNFAAARHCFDAFLRQFPDHAPGLEYRARLLRDVGDYPGAVADFTRLFELQERPNPGHYISVAEMLRASGRDGIAPALAIIDRGNEQLGIIPSLQRRAIELELERQRVDLAIERLGALEPMLGESPDWKVDMAELLQRDGQVDQAAKLLAAALLQLDYLRKTPARLALGERAENLLTLPSR